MRTFAKWCALQNIELIKPYCSENDYNIIHSYLTSAGNKEVVEVRVAAEAARAAGAAARQLQEDKLRELFRVQKKALRQLEKKDK